MKKKKNINHLKTNTDEHYAVHIARDIIKRKSLWTLVHYIYYSWDKYPKLKEKDLLNVITEEYLNKQKGKYEKNNIVKFDITKLN